MTPRKQPARSQKQRAKPKKDITSKLREIAGKLLDRLEAAMDDTLPDTVLNTPQRQQHNERLFGSKASLTSTLIVLAELILKLEQVQHKNKPGDQPMHDTAQGVLSAADIELVNVFIRKNQPGKSITSTTEAVE